MSLPSDVLDNQSSESTPRSEVGGSSAQRTSTSESELSPSTSMSSPLVAVAMGSISDLEIMSQAADTLAHFGIAHELRILSAHRTPHETLSFAAQAAERGLRIIIAGAGGAAHLPGLLASATSLPVIGVPIPLRQLDGLDSLLSIVQMPSGIPVATVSIGGAKNAALLAVRILAVTDGYLRERMDAFRDEMASESLANNAKLTTNAKPNSKQT